ncbi:DNA repair protein RadA [Phormidesmis priestleyi]|uniref:DNA repair protein RadA n=1 Tax=Phormidesmis priestleyi TaxID=268141 RepID=UPI00083A51D3|nr:DNA repair protein RadA [Phormidesmis priestleyi]
MPKLRSHFVCNQCGAESPQYFGRCPSCAAWNSLEEQVARSTTSSTTIGQVAHRRTNGKSSTSTRNAPTRAVSSLTLPQITDHPQSRLSSGYIELDRVLGGGIVPGSLVLIGGDPGIGKSTLLLQTANRLATRYRTLYVCAEESGQQVKLRAQRLGIGKQAVADDVDEESLESASPQPSIATDADLYLLPETDLDTILVELEALKPTVAVIDSIQALYYSSLSSAPGSVAQVRECTSVLMQVAKRQNITLFIVGHVTKEGAIAGPKVLEHLVDTVLYFEGDRFASHRLLRSVKNRFGATHEIGVFEMVDQGLQEVLNPSELFLGNREEATPGTATIVACEGTRPIVVELQALVSATSYSSPRRSTTGIEYNRLLQILAVLEKRVGIPLSKLDAYVSSSGGLSVGEPAADLGIAVAVAASFRDRSIDPQTVVIGEVGLGGQVRSVSQMELRLKEAAKLGFKRAIVPKGSYSDVPGMEVIPVSRVVDAMAIALAGSKSRQQAESVENEE